MRISSIIWLNLLFCFTCIGQVKISGIIYDANQKRLSDANIFINNTALKSTSDKNGKFTLKLPQAGTYSIVFFKTGYQTQQITQYWSDTSRQIKITLLPLKKILDEVEVQAQAEEKHNLESVVGFALYESKKSEVIHLNKLTANLATNNPRQTFSKIPGLHIWESDGAGLQLGIGGRGLSPNRSSNFNTRQNGYDISADALGYPESYYTPPLEAIDRVEVVRGAASLQYGTQFGGLLNFKFKNGMGNKPIQVTSRLTGGSFGFLNSFTSVGGQVKKVNYYSFYQYKAGKGWRQNSDFQQHNLFASANYKWNERLSMKAEYTHMEYLSQQAGGLTDQQFKQNPRQSLRTRNWFEVTWNLASVHFTYNLNPTTKLNHRMFGLLGKRNALGNLTQINRPDHMENRDLLMDTYRNWGAETRFLKHYTVGKQYFTFLGGMRYYEGHTHKMQGEGDDGDGPSFKYLSIEKLSGSDYQFPSRNLALFCENIVAITDRWSITPGLRFEYINTNADGYYRQINKDLAGNILLDSTIYETIGRSRNILLAGMGTSYRMSDKLELYANFSQNYRAINFNDMRIANPNLKVDPNLQDERGFNADIGIRGSLGELIQGDLSLFNLNYRNRIGAMLTSEIDPFYGYRTYRLRTNVAHANLMGMEFSGEFHWSKLFEKQTDIAFSYFLNASYINGVYYKAQESAVEGHQVELVPPVNIRTGINATIKNWTASYQFNYVGEHFSDATNASYTATAVEGIIPSYTVMDLSAAYTYKWLKIEGTIQNLADRMYFTRRAAGYPGPGIIPADGRSFYLTLQVTF